MYKLINKYPEDKLKSFFKTLKSPHLFFFLTQSSFICMKISCSIGPIKSYEQKAIQQAQEKSIESEKINKDQDTDVEEEPGKKIIKNYFSLNKIPTIQKRKIKNVMEDNEDENIQNEDDDISTMDEKDVFKL